MFAVTWSAKTLTAVLTVMSIAAQMVMTQRVHLACFIKTRAHHIWKSWLENNAENTVVESDVACRHAGSCKELSYTNNIYGKNCICLTRFAKVI